jgi:hypothetical protein
LFVNQSSSEDHYYYNSCRNGSFLMPISHEVNAEKGTQFFIRNRTVTERGLIGDRAYILIDQETGKVASAKNSRKWEISLTFVLPL